MGSLHHGITQFLLEINSKILLVMYTFVRDFKFQQKFATIPFDSSRETEYVLKEKAQLFFLYVRDGATPSIPNLFVFLLHVLLPILCFGKFQFQLLAFLQCFLRSFLH